MKIDMHVHSYYSWDGVSSPKKILEKAKQKGIDGIAITEHNNIDSYEEFKKIADSLNMFVIKAEEVKTKQGDVLAYFINSKIEKGKDAKETIREIREQGGISVIAHPFHFKEYFKDDISKYDVDGIEVFNSRIPFKKNNKSALEFAEKNNKKMFAGSDCHISNGVGDAYVEVDANTIEDFKQGIIDNKHTYHGKTSSFLCMLAPLIGKIRNIFVK